MLILIFRPFFIWRWTTHLRDHPLALRAQVVCTKQAADVNEIFRAYGRLFNFQYQTYLVSYCVYTAATIDVRLMRHEDRGLAEKAADRLVVTLRMLETELKQTPGIRRSIEIIRSHLGKQRLPILNEYAIDARHEQLDSSRSSNNRGEKCQGYEISPSTLSSSSYIPSSSRSGIQLQKLPIVSALAHHLPLPLQSTHLNQNADIYEQSTQQHNNQDIRPETPDIIPPIPPITLPTPGTANTNLNPDLATYIDAQQLNRINMPWFDWNVDDSGGGFVPDMAYWGAMQYG